MLHNKQENPFWSFRKYTVHVDLILVQNTSKKWYTHVGIKSLAVAVWDWCWIFIHCMSSQTFSLHWIRKLYIFCEQPQQMYISEQVGTLLSHIWNFDWQQHFIDERNICTHITTIAIPKGLNNILRFYYLLLFATCIFIKQLFLISSTKWIIVFVWIVINRKVRVLFIK